MNLTISSRKVEGVAVLDLSGRLVLGKEADFLRDSVRSLVDKGEKKILLNFAEMSYMDSGGLGMLISSYTTVRNHQGKLKLLKLSAKLHELLRFTGFLTLFEVFDDEAEAVKSFS